MKDKFFQLRLSEQDRKQLDVISEHHGRGKADMLRRLILEEHQRIKSTTTSPALPAPSNAPEPEWGMED